jgi:Aldehyde oxidase and xanthine dehydrogenase, a/b hammerhead domain/Molybdopterin cofactor-binding domain
VTAVAETKLLGDPVDRVDGPLKVTGAAPFPSDVNLPDLAHAALARSTIAAGRISHIDTVAAEAAPGVLALITHENAPTLERGPLSVLGPAPQAPLQDDRVLHYGQYVAVVVAETPQEAAAAARLIEPDYEPAEALLDVGDSRGALHTNPWGIDMQRGDVDEGLAVAEITYEARFTTAENTNNPLGPFATVAAWDGETVTVYDTTQWTSNVRAAVATAFQLPETAVRVHAPYVGGGVRGGPARLAARAPGGARRTDGATAGQAGPHPAADVHRHRPPPQHRAEAQDRRQARRRTGRHRPPGNPWRRDGRREHRAGHAGQLQRLCLPERLRPRPPAAAEHPTSRTDARARRGAGELRPGVRHRRTVLRAGHGSAGAAAAQLHRGPAAFRPALVEQGPAGVLRGRRRAVRLVAPEPGGGLDARRALAGGLRPGRPQLQLVAGPLRSPSDHAPRRNRLGAQRRQRHRHRDLHGDEAAVGRAARP